MEHESSKVHRMMARCNVVCPPSQTSPEVIVKKQIPHNTFLPLVQHFALRCVLYIHGNTMLTHIRLCPTQLCVLKLKAIEPAVSAPSRHTKQSRLMMEFVPFCALPIVLCRRRVEALQSEGQRCRHLHLHVRECS